MIAFDMGQRDLLIYFVKLLNRFHVSYLLTGSFAVAFYGRPRATHDIDFVIEVLKKNSTQIKKVIDSLGSEFIFDKKNLNLEAETTMFNILHEDSTIKIDFWVINENEFSEKFSRRHEAIFEKLTVNLISAEDLILTKLLWCKQVFSERHFRDCIGIWQVQKGKIDTGYLQKRAKELGVNKLLQDVSRGIY